MQNLDGSLGFKATLDIDDFNVSAQAMERNIRRVSTTAISESAQMEQSLLAFAQNGARYIVTYLVGQGMGSLLQSIVQTRGQFQQLEIAFGTMLKSDSKAKQLMDELVVTAAKTPFDLQGIANSAKQMMAYGSSVDSVVDELVMLGNVASGVGAPLGEIAYLYGTLRTQGRAYTMDIRQFAGRGIPIYEELAKVMGVAKDQVSDLVSEGKVGFADVEKVFRNLTSSTGMYYNLMERQSASLTGQISNLGDAWDSALNKLGTDNQDLFASAISGATYLVEHFEDVLRIVKAITIAYGSYKAAIVLNTLATKGYTGVALLDNTARQAKIALMKLDANLTGQTAKQTQIMTAAEKAHTAALQQKLTVEEHANLVKKLRIATIQQLLTAQQQEYLSNLNLTASSANYEAVAMGVLTVEQREALSKTDLSAKSAIYRAALAQEVAAKTQNQAATLNSMRAEVSAAAAKVEAAKQGAIASMQAAEAARYEVYWAKQSGQAYLVAAAEKKLESALENQALARKAALAAQTDFFARKKALEASATRQSTAATVADTTAKAANAAGTSILTAVTTKATLAMKTLWASMMSNPIGWLTSVLGVLLSVFTLLDKKEDEIADGQIGLANATKKAREEFATQASKVDALQKVLSSSNQAYSERIKALKELKKIVPDYNAELTKEGKIINDNTKAIQEYLTRLEKQIKLKAAQEELEASYREKRLKEKEIVQKQSAYDTANSKIPGVAYGDAGAEYQLHMLKEAGRAENQLKQAQRELTVINKSIEELNNEINTTSLALDNSTNSTKSYAAQVQDAREKISSLTKELSDLRSGKIANNNLAQEIEEKTKELNTAKRNLELLTGEKGAASIDDQYAQKRIEADFKLEEERISVMEDGYAKRKATLDLQHKKNLAQIDKEEKELAEARRKAGKGGLFASEKTGFEERRNLENQSYEKANTDLFDEEISYRKEQYQLYFRWVEALGVDVAEKQFAELLKGGTSYSQWINQEIAKLEQKKAQNPSSFSSGDQANLFSLTIQREEINGVKSAMDRFSEGVSQSVGQAATLAAKIEAIAQAKEKLANGEFKLGKDDTLAAHNQLDQMEREAQQELNQTILNDFKSYEEKKREIAANFAAMRLTDIAQNNAELLARINKGEVDALSAINAEQLQASADWKDLFQNLDSLTAGEIQKLITSIEKAMANADLKLSPVDYQALLDSLNKAKDKVVELNPFRALGGAFDNYIQACKKLKRAEQDNLSPEQIQALEKEVKTSAKQMITSIQSINQAVGSVGNSISALASSFGGDELADTIGGVTAALGGAGQAATGVGQIMSGDLMGGITSVIGGVTSVIGSFNKMHDAKKEKQIKRLQEQVDQLASAYDDLGDAIGRAYSTDKASMLNQQSENLKQQNEKIRQQIQAEKEKKDTDWDRIKEWEKQIAENEKQVAENTKYNIIDAINGTDIMSAIDDLSAAYADAWAAGETAAGKSADNVKKMIRTAIIEQLKNKLKPEVEKFMTYLATAMKDGVISKAEEDILEQMSKDMEDISDKYLSQNKKWIHDGKNEREDALSGAVRSMSEETGGVIAGRLNAIVINQSDQAVIMRNQLIYQAEIAANTRVSAERLGNIESTLKRIETKGSSLLSQGIS